MTGIEKETETIELEYLGEKIKLNIIRDCRVDIDINDLCKEIKEAVIGNHDMLEKDFSRDEIRKIFQRLDGYIIELKRRPAEVNVDVTGKTSVKERKIELYSEPLISTNIDFRYKPGEYLFRLNNFFRKTASHELFHAMSSRNSFSGFSNDEDDMFLILMEGVTSTLARSGYEELRKLLPMLGIGKVIPEKIKKAYFFNKKSELYRYFKDEFGVEKNELNQFSINLNKYFNADLKNNEEAESCVLRFLVKCALTKLKKDLDKMKNQKKPSMEIEKLKNKRVRNLFKDYTLDNLVKDELKKKRSWLFKDFPKNLMDLLYDVYGKTYLMGIPAVQSGEGAEKTKKQNKQK